MNKHMYPHPKFTIITVTYNAAKVLEETIQSILSQSYKNVEYIIVDGQSKDGTLQIIDKYRRWIHCLISEPDKGLYDAMNKGIQLATGDYLCFLNAGDKFHETNTLQHIVHSLKKNELPDVIYGETDIVDHNGEFLHMRRLSAPEKLNWKSFKKGMLVCHQAFFAKRELAVQEPYSLRYRFSADFDWCIRCMQEGERRGMMNVYVREPLTDYLHEGMTTANHRASLQERFSIMAKHYGLVPTVLYHIGFVFRIIKNKVKRF